VKKIGQFQALRKLSLHDNEIGGSIPTSLGFLPNLRGVQIYKNMYVKAIHSFFWHDPYSTNETRKSTTSINDAIHKSIRGAYILEFPCVLLFNHMFMGLRKYTSW